MEYKGVIAAHTTPKITEGGCCWTMSSRDFKDPMIVVYAIHEADGQTVTMMEEKAYALVTGGQARTRIPCGTD